MRDLDSVTAIAPLPTPLLSKKELHLVFVSLKKGVGNDAADNRLDTVTVVLAKRGKGLMRLFEKVFTVMLNTQRSP